MTRLLLLLAALCGSGCIAPDDPVFGGFLLGLPYTSEAGQEAELTVFVGRGRDAVTIATNPIEDAEAFATTGDQRFVLPHVDSGFYLSDSQEVPGLRYVAETSWTLGATFDGVTVSGSGESPPPPQIFGGPLDGVWPANTALDLSLPLDDADRGFYWVIGPDGEVSSTDEPLDTGSLLEWLDEEPGYVDVHIPAEAFSSPGRHELVVVAARDVRDDSIRGAHPRSAVALANSSSIQFEVQ